MVTGNNEDEERRNDVKGCYDDSGTTKVNVTKGIRNTEDADYNTDKTMEITIATTAVTKTMTREVGCRTR